MSRIASSPHTSAPGLVHMPVSIFASVMGVMGLGLAWRKAAAVAGLPPMVGEGIVALGILVLVITLAAYGIKALHFPSVVIGEFNHPIRSAFFSTLPIGLLLTAAGIHPYSVPVAVGVWALGALLQIVLTVRLILRWLEHRQDILQANPAWFIPIVGNIVVPLLGGRLGLTDLSWFFFSVGMLFWPPMLAILLYRLIFHDDLPPRLAPTLFILIPPAAIGYLAYVTLTGCNSDPFALILVNGALFLTLTLLVRAPRFLRLPFAVSWWAFTFPLDAMALAALEHGHALGGTVWPITALAVLVVTTLVVGVVLARTLAGTMRGTLFVPE